MEKRIDFALPAGTVLASSERTYTVESVLGAGGFGVTYKATATISVQNIEVEVHFAIKEHFLNALCEREGDTSRVKYSAPVRQQVEGSLKDFIGEARRLQKIGVSHPNIVSVNEVFEANNTAYYVMEYIDGESLRSYVQRNGPLGEAGLRRLLLPVMDAVEALHAERLTHLDIKPDNIMLARRKDGSIRPVLIDFGLAKHYGADGTPTSTVNTLGCSAGYSPMEQYMGIRTFSPTADVYALGATMLYCLTGETPRAANEITSDDISGAIPAGVSEALRHTISEAMEASARARTQSVRAMVGNLGGEMPEPAAGCVNAGGGGGNASGGKDTVVITGGSGGSVRQGKLRRRVYAVAGVMAALVAVAVIMMLAFRGSGDGLSVGIDDTAGVAEEGFDWRPLSRLENLALACERDGEYFYFSQPNWEKIPVSEKSCFSKKGVVVIGNGERFILDLHDNREYIKWDEAMAQYGNELPTKSQAEAMASNYKEINAAIVAFGGDIDMRWAYWTRTEKGSSYAWGVGMNIGGVTFYYKTTSAWVRSVAPVPVAQEQQPKPQEFDWRSLSRLENLSLACERDGEYFYFSRSNWEEIPVSEKSRFSKKGVVVIGNGERFILVLHDNGKGITWHEAMAQYGNRLPTKSQGDVMASNRIAIKAAIIDFGGDRPNQWYWTRTEYDSTLAWGFNMSDGYVTPNGNTSAARVRSVAPVPVAPAI